MNKDNKQDDEDVRPIPINEKIFDEIVDKIGEALDGQPLKESIVAMILGIHDCIEQQDKGDITLGQVIDLIRVIQNKTKKIKEIEDER